MNPTVAILFCLFCLCRSVYIYPYLNDPSTHPDYERYAVKHPTYRTFGDGPKFMTLRSFQIHDLVVDYKSDIDLYLLNPATSLGSIIQPTYALLFAKNFKEVVDYITEKGLYLGGIRGFVPGSGPGIGQEYIKYHTQQFYPPNNSLNYLEMKLRDKWLGMSAGEQDGRYFGFYGGEMLPTNVDKFYQYLNFRMHFKGIEDILGPKMFGLNSLTLPHYYMKTGLYVLNGAETAQSLPNAQVFYSFVRGAGKQYGSLWFGKVSIFNKFGFKNYTNSTGNSDRKIDGSNNVYNYTCSSQLQCGPTCGTSLNLMKRLMYAHIMYNSACVGFENDFFIGTSGVLSPIGMIQHAAKNWVEKFGSVGTHIATIGLLLDFYTGWVPPRHHYETIEDRVWDNLPYSEGDFFTDSLLQLIYPRYQDSGYFHNETGFSSATPYGDSMDVILTDAALWDMQKYDTLIIASAIQYTKEVSSNLEKYIRSGGNVIVTANNFALFQDDFYPFLKVKLDLTSCESYSANEPISLNLSGTFFLTEKYPMLVCDSHYQGEVLPLAQTKDGKPLALFYQPSDSLGYVLIFTTPYGISSEVINKPTNNVDTPLYPAFPLLHHVQLFLDNFLARTSIVQMVNAELSHVTNYLQHNDYLVLVTNPKMAQQPLSFTGTIGKVVKVTEHPLDQSEKDKVGYLPDGYEGTDLGISTDTTIAGVDTRLFTVTLDSDVVKIIDKVKPKPRPNGVVLHLRQISNSLMDEIHRRPTFFRHFDSVIVDYSYVMSKDNDYLMTEAKWASQQNLKVYIDASPAIDLFPKLRLINNSAIAFNKSYDDLKELISKLIIYQVTDLIISLHKAPELHDPFDDVMKQFNKTLHSLVQMTRSRINIHLRDAIKNPTGGINSTYWWLRKCGLDHSIQMAPNLALLLQHPVSDISQIITSAGFVFLNAPEVDMFGAQYTVNGPIHMHTDLIKGALSDICHIRSCPYQSQLKANSSISLVVDAYLPTINDEYLDVAWLEQFLMDSYS